MNRCREFYQAERPLVAACAHYARELGSVALVLADADHEAFLAERASDLGVNFLARASGSDAACVALTLEGLCALLEGSGGDIDVVRSRLQHSRGARPLLVLYQGKYLLVQPGEHHHATA